MMIYCSNCGAEHPAGATYCSSCGKSIEAAVHKPRTDSFRACGEDTASTANTVNAAASINAVGKKIESHMIKAIISAVCCCLPFGIVAIVYAAQVGPKLSVGDINAAAEASQKAGMWANLAIGIGILMQILWIGLSKFAFNNMFLEFLQTTVN